MVTEAATKIGVLPEVVGGEEHSSQHLGRFDEVVNVGSRCLVSAMAGDALAIGIEGCEIIKMH